MNILKYIWRVIMDFDARLRRRFERTAIHVLTDLFKSPDIEVDHKVKILHAFCELKKQCNAELKILVELYDAQSTYKNGRPPPKKRKWPGQSLQDVINNIYGLESVSAPAPGIGAPAPPLLPAETAVVS